MDTEARRGGLEEQEGVAAEGEHAGDGPGSGTGLWASAGNTGGLGVWVGVLGGDDTPEAVETQGRGIATSTKQINRCPHDGDQVWGEK